MKIEIEPEVLTAVVEAFSSVTKARIEAEATITRAFGAGIIRLVELAAPAIQAIAEAEAEAARARGNPVDRLRELLDDLGDHPESVSFSVGSGEKRIKVSRKDEYKKAKDHRPPNSK